MKFGVILGVVALAGFAAPAVAQSLAPSASAINPVPQNDDTTRILVDVTRVNMLFTVTDKKGRFVTDLTKDDFEVIESKKPQSIQEFTAESDLPLRIGGGSAPGAPCGPEHARVQRLLQNPVAGARGPCRRLMRSLPAIRAQ